MTMDSQGSSTRRPSQTPQLPSYPSNNIAVLYLKPYQQPIILYSKIFRSFKRLPRVFRMKDLNKENEIKSRETQMDGNIQEVLNQLENLRDGMSMENFVELILLGVIEVLC
ncbi:25433_t:CDS:2 [Dentiscutata erythropus]|uniref:25433_t:CDS:1 n=1 Tax=Dentiscutata erythropus TaxID=1348616 RepID=A0A9N9EWZ1_9GLOM|nr:25433_t:CDS:2 [Dentiscutata erythropus]